MTAEGPDRVGGLVSGGELAAARALLRDVARPTPAVVSHSLSRRCGREVWLKPEHLQRTGSFKIRGAYTMLSSLPTGTPVVAASAGNHAQGVALAASLLGMSATIFMPTSVSLPKLQATRSYGATVHLGGVSVADAIEAARSHATATGAVVIPPFDDRRVIAGQGTIGLELLDEVPGLEAVAVVIGGGGLCSGVAAALKQLRPGVRTVGVMAEGADSMARSVAAGEPVLVHPRTIADGIALAGPSPLTLAHVQAFVDDLVTVSDDAIARAVLLLAERTKSVVEPAGAAAMAAVLEGLVPGHGPVAVVLSGGNIDALLLAKLLEFGLGASGRFLRLVIVVEDRPGALAGLTDLVAALGLNVIDVEHHRAGLRLPLGGVEVVMTVETRDQDHRTEVVGRLRGAGYTVEVDE